MGMADKGYYRSVEPVAVAPLSNVVELRRAFRQTIERGNPIVPLLSRAEHPEPVILKYAGLKSWSAFARGTVVWDIQNKDGIWRIIGHRRRPDRGWERDPDQETSFTPIDAVIDRMIAILQAAAAQ